MSTRVRVGLGSTINTGNFESVRVDIAVETDLLESEGVDDGITRVFNKVEKHVEDKIEEMRRDLESFSDGN